MVTLTARGLGKRYGERWAVRGLDLELPAGSVTGFLGRNGAGKTTVIRLLAGLVRPTTGRVLIEGPPGARIAAVLDQPAFDGTASARENLQNLSLVAALPDDGAVDTLLDRVGLTGDAERPVAGFSSGMVKRLAIAWALVLRPDLLLLDEPFEGLDPQTRVLLRTIIRKTASQGVTVLLSSHLLEELEDLCDRMAVIRDGVLLWQGNRIDMGGTAAGGALVHLDVEPLEEALRVLEGADVVGSGLQLRLSREDVPATVAALVRSGVRVFGVSSEEPSLEELYLKLDSSSPSPRDEEEDEHKKTPGATPKAPLPRPPSSWKAALRLELRSLLGRRLHLALLALPLALPLLFSLGLVLGGPFLGGYRTKYLIPGLTGTFMLTLSLDLYVFPVLAALGAAHVFTASAGDGTLGTTLLTGISRYRLYGAKLGALILFLLLPLALMPPIYLLDLGLIRLLIDPAWWAAFRHPVGAVMTGFLAVLAPYALAQVVLAAYWSLFTVRARGVVTALAAGLAPLVVLAVLGVLADSIMPLLGLSWNPAPAFLTSQYAAVGDFDLLHGVFNHGIRNWPPFIRRDLLLLFLQGLACALVAARLFRDRDVAGARAS